jgi:hypothetical protein
MRHKLSEYGFDNNVGYKSYIEQKGAIYPDIENSFRPTCSCLYHDHYDTEIPMLSAVMTRTKNIIFDGFVKLQEHYAPKQPIIIEGVQTTVSLNGKTITAPVFSESKGKISEGNTDSYAFWVKSGSELIIEGDGEIIARPANYSMAVWANGGKVIIKGGKFYNNGNNSDLIYASNDALVEIYGGEFHANKNEGAEGTKNAYPALNIKDAHRKTAKIIVYGGKFFGFDPANNVSEGSNTNFVADGYKSMEIEPGVWEVMPA